MAVEGVGVSGKDQKIEIKLLANGCLSARDIARIEGRDFDSVAANLQKSFLDTLQKKVWSALGIPASVISEMETLSAATKSASVQANDLQSALKKLKANDQDEQDALKIAEGVSMIGSLPQNRAKAKHEAYRAVRGYCFATKELMPITDWRDWGWDVQRYDYLRKDVIVFNQNGFTARVTREDLAGVFNDNADHGWKVESVARAESVDLSAFAWPTSPDELAEAKKSAAKLIRAFCIQHERKMPKAKPSTWTWETERVGAAQTRLMASYLGWRAVLSMGNDGLPIEVMFTEQPWTASSSEFTVPTGKVSPSWLDDAIASFEGDPVPESLANLPASIVHGPDGNVIGITVGKDVVIKSDSVAMKPATFDHSKPVYLPKGVSVAILDEPKETKAPSTSPAPATSSLPSWMRSAGKPGRRVDV